MPSSRSIARADDFMSSHTDFLSHSATSAPPNTECPICLEGIEEHICVQIVGIPGCKHLVGMECLQAMLNSHPDAKKICPLCRTEWLGNVRGRGRRGRGEGGGDDYNDYDDDDGREAYNDFTQDARYHDAASDAYYSDDYQGEIERVRRQQDEQMKQYRQGQAARHAHSSRHGRSSRSDGAGHIDSGSDPDGGHGPSSHTHGAGHMGSGRDPRADRDLRHLNGESSRSHPPPSPVYRQSSHRHGPSSRSHGPPSPVYGQSSRGYSPPPHSSHRGCEASSSVAQRPAHDNPDISEANWQSMVSRIQGPSSSRAHGASSAVYGESSCSHCRPSSPVYGQSSGSYPPPSCGHGRGGGSINALTRYDAYGSDSDDAACGNRGGYYSY